MSEQHRDSDICTDLQNPIDLEMAYTSLTANWIYANAIYTSFDFSVLNVSPFVRAHIEQQIDSVCNYARLFFNCFYECENNERYAPMITLDKKSTLRVSICIFPIYIPSAICQKGWKLEISL